MDTTTRDDKADLAELTRGYGAERSRVDAAYRRMRAITAVPHAPAQAREAARELTVALSTATATATRTLQAAALTLPPRRHLARRQADRSVPAAVRPWSAELVRLAAIGSWLRRVTLDDTGVQLPIARQVADYAAKGPHIAGLDFGNQAVEPPGGPRIGIDLRATIDATNPANPIDPSREAAATAAASIAPTVA